MLRCLFDAAAGFDRGRQPVAIKLGTGRSLQIMKVLSRSQAEQHTEAANNPNLKRVIEQIVRRLRCRGIVPSFPRSIPQLSCGHRAIAPCVRDGLPPSPRTGCVSLPQ
jgi:hypothetical protein